MLGGRKKGEGVVAVSKQSLIGAHAMPMRPPGECMGIASDLHFGRYGRCDFLATKCTNCTPPFSQYGGLETATTLCPNMAVWKPQLPFAPIWRFGNRHYPLPQYGGLETATTPFPNMAVWKPPIPLSHSHITNLLTPKLP